MIRKQAKLQTPVMVAIAGGSASGKSFLAEALSARAELGAVTLVALDSYYHDFTALCSQGRSKINFDEPESFDFPLLVEHLQSLKNGFDVLSPVYDFTTHGRSAEQRSLHAAPVVICEGILVLEPPALRSLFDIKIFVATEARLRFERRLSRDQRQRGRSAESVFEQWSETVEPSYLKFVEPTRNFADFCISGEAINEQIVDDLLSKIQAVRRS